MFLVRSGTSKGLLPTFLNYINTGIYIKLILIMTGKCNLDINNNKKDEF